MADTNKERADFDIWWQEERRRTWIAAGCHVERGPEPSEHWSESHEDPAWAAWQGHAAKTLTKEPTLFQVHRIDGSTLAQWEQCTRDFYEATLKTGRYGGFDDGPASEARALYTAQPDPRSEQMMGVLSGVVTLAKAAHAHWDANRDAKVGKILLALAGRNEGYDYRADNLHELLAPPQVGRSQGGDR